MDQSPRKRYGNTPKKWREALGIPSGDILKARKEGNKVIIESQKFAPYRTYTDKEITELLEEDKLSPTLEKKVSKHIASIT